MAAVWFGFRGSVYTTLAVSTVFSFHRILPRPTRRHFWGLFEPSTCGSGIPGSLPSPVSHDKALSEIRKEAGSHFDRRVMAAFESIARELLQAVMEKNEMMAENGNGIGETYNK
jgi:hypothetical protein